MKWISIVSGCLLIACSGGSPPSGPGGGTTGGPVATITITSAAPAFTSLGESVTLTAVARDASGNEVGSATLTWSSSDPSVIEITPTAGGGARATARANGNATITVASGSVTANTAGTVNQTVAGFDFSGSVTAVELPGESAQLSATAEDARGNAVPGATVTWSSATPGVATVTPAGLATAVGFGNASIEATAGGFTSGVTFEVLGDRFFLNGPVRLRYTLDLPDDSGGPFPAVIWAHGSGMLDRNAQRIGTDPLVPRGLAALRFDKRGVGESTGNFPGGDVRILATDVAAGVAFLRKLSVIDPNRIGIMGNSQGGWIGPLAAQGNDDVSFMMMWSGPTVSIGLEIFYSSLAEGTNTPLDDVYAQLPNFNGPPIFDPMPVLRTLDIPSLWLFGGMDRSIPTRLDTVNMRTLQSEGLPYEFVWFPEGRHDLRDNDSGMGAFIDVWSVYEAWLRRMGIL